VARSALFSQFDVQAAENQQFEPDLRALIGLEDETRQQLLKHLPQWVVDRGGDARAQQFAEDADAPTEDLMAAISCYAVFVRKLFEADNVDQPEQWVADLTEALALSDDEAQQLSAALTPLMDLSLASFRQRLARRQPGVLPEFDSIETRVELRAIFEPTFVLGGDLARYAPTVRDLVPIVSVSLGTHTEERFHLQVHVDDLRLMVEKLQATLKEAESLEDVVQAVRSG